MKLHFRILIFLSILFWTSLIFIELIASKLPYLINFIPFFKKAFSLVCHQQHNKLLVIYNTETLVCSRCLGIYLGFLIMSLYNLFKEINIQLKIKIFIISAAPAIIDVTLTTVGIYPYSKLIAFTSGFLLGSIVFLYFYQSLTELISENRRIRIEKVH
ncbi:DUF2085 domain-containing protein [Melioribacteraceae bacterium 4301-Me]|uniref:DUF2085 domain-containing protein n=1 Tax=Pyranulibacter aquaticus TaxID=3163344 RepID=UPI0035969420